MPLDAICINALKTQLAPRITGMKIDKVQQPARDIVLLILRGDGRSEKLLLSCGTGSARAHFTSGSFENPQSPPMFCMLLRKHLIGARVSDLSQPDFERMLVFHLAAFDEMGEYVEKKLVAEMMGRNSNIILTGPEGHIIDCLRRVDGDMSHSRQVLPGLLYRLPPKQNKPYFPLLRAEEIKALWGAAREKQEENGADDWLLKNFSGLSPLVCREICHRAAGETSKPVSRLSEAESEVFLEELLSLKNRISEGRFEPSMIVADGSPKDFSFMPVRQYENAAATEVFAGFSELLDEFHTMRDKRELLRRKSQTLLKSIKSARDREERKLNLRRQELQKAGERELFRKRGDLVTANLHRLKKGDRYLECEDYFEEDSPIAVIPLDPLKTPQQNAAAFYREYSKAKTAEGYLTGLIEKGERESEYLASVIDELERAENERDLDEIRRELTETGWVKPQKNTKKANPKDAKKQKQGGPARFVSSSGMEILVGRNNAQSDMLTTKLARRNDVWLHVQRLHGSHVVISCNDVFPDDTTLSEAAGLAVYFSQGRAGGKAPVDYTFVRNVKKPAGAMPGAVIYTDYKTIVAEPDSFQRDDHRRGEL